MAMASRGERRWARASDEIHAVHELHQEVIEFAGLTKVVNGHDVRMAQPGERTGFAGETFSESGVATRVLGQDLERHQSIEGLLPGFVNGTHAAIADELEDIQWREMRGEFVDGG
jgi:hypothetical protein